MYWGILVVNCCLQKISFPPSIYMEQAKIHIHMESTTYIIYVASNPYPYVLSMCIRKNIVWLEEYNMSQYIYKTWYLPDEHARQYQCHNMELETCLGSFVWETRTGNNEILQQIENSCLYTVATRPERINCFTHAWSLKWSRLFSEEKLLKPTW